MATKTYGKPEKITYSYFMAGAKTYIYAKQGVTFVVNEQAGVIYEKHYYLSMSLDEYMKTWGRGLPVENPYKK